MKQLIHNGVIVIKNEAMGLSIFLRGEKVRLSPEQEEMAVAWVKKLGTEYAEDKTFAKNFFQDFAQALGRDDVKPSDIDFSEIEKYVIEEKNRKLTMPREEKKLQAQERKALREANREKYGYAIVDGLRVEVGNYTVEPSSIFMGRGRHPMRGKWKSGAKENDVVLNMSPDAPRPKGDWKEIVWLPDSMWIAKWRDNLQDEWKYVWLSDASYVKQKRDIEKFSKAGELEDKLKEVKAHIERNLTSPDPLRRKIATVCCLVDALKFRVGDEKDEDEADTVGATTLRPEHVSFGQGGQVTFDFLGKDSVQWHIETTLPEQVVNNMKEFAANFNSSIFKGVRSDNVGAFLEEAMLGLTAKVFRTYHATKIVRRNLEEAKVSSDSPEYVKKYAATMANLEAAKACNHQKKIPKNWNETLARMRERLKKYEQQKREARAKKTGKKEARIRRLERIDERIRNLQTGIEIKRATRGYNLNTSLKSYIDPRVYYQWGSRIGYDWKRYYPKGLQRKFLWVEGKPADNS